MKTIFYSGPFADGVVIASTGQHALPGKPIEVDEEVADRLLEQDVWSEDAPAPTDGKKAQRNRPTATTDEPVEPAPAPDDGADETAV